ALRRAVYVATNRGSWQRLAGVNAKRLANSAPRPLESFLQEPRTEGALLGGSDPKDEFGARHSECAGAEGKRKALLCGDPVAVHLRPQSNGQLDSRDRPLRDVAGGEQGDLRHIALMVVDDEGEV